MTRRPHPDLADTPPGLVASFGDAIPGVRHVVVAGAESGVAIRSTALSDAAASVLAEAGRCLAASGTALAAALSAGAPGTTIVQVDEVIVLHRSDPQIGHLLVVVDAAADLGLVTHEMALLTERLRTATDRHTPAQALWLGGTAP